MGRTEELVNRKKRSQRVAAAMGAGWILATLAFVFCGPCQYTCGAMTGYKRAIEEYLEACSPVRSRMGTPISLGMFGWSSGNYVSGRHDGEGRAWAKMPVSGPNGSARVDYVMQKTAGVWYAEKLILRWPDGALVDVKACVASWEAGRRERGALAAQKSRCAEGQAEACVRLAETLSGQGRHAEARAHRERACRLGLASACDAPP